MISSFLSKVSEIPFNKPTEVFNYEKNSNSNTHIRDLNEFSATQVAFDDALDEEHVMHFENLSTFMAM